MIRKTSISFFVTVFSSVSTAALAWTPSRPPDVASSRSTSGVLAVSNGHVDNDDSSKSLNHRRQFLNFAAAAAAVGTAGMAWSTNPTVAMAAAVVEDTAKKVGGKPVFGEEFIMSQKGHGTSAQPVQSDLLYGVDVKLADKICNYNRHFAEMGGYYRSTSWEEQVLNADGPITFYDSVTGKPLFVAPINRSKESLLAESRVHGWPSFRDAEVVWDNVRVLRNSGETVSVDGTHLGHNLPDKMGNRYCINLVSIAGQPATTKTTVAVW